MQLVLEKSSKIEFHTDLRQIFQAINNRQRDFNWLITDLEYLWLGVHPAGDEGPSFNRSEGPYRMSGHDLTVLVAKYQIQAIEGAFLGFPPSVAIDSVFLEDKPHEVLHRQLWHEGRMDHPLAELQIECFDGACTLLFCKDPSIGESFQRYFPEAVDLHEFNRIKGFA